MNAKLGMVAWRSWWWVLVHGDGWRCTL